MRYVCHEGRNESEGESWGELGEREGVRRVRKLEIIRIDVLI